MGETVFAALLAVLVGHRPRHAARPSPLWCFGGGCMTALGFPAYQAILPDLVDRDELLGAISLSMAQYNLGRVVGPGAGRRWCWSLGSYTLGLRPQRRCRSAR